MVMRARGRCPQLSMDELARIPVDAELSAAFMPRQKHHRHLQRHSPPDITACLLRIHKLKSSEPGMIAEDLSCSCFAAC